MKGLDAAGIRALVWKLIFGSALLVLAAAWLTFNYRPDSFPAPRDFVLEWVKSLLELAVLVIAGAALKVVLDESAAARRRDEQISDRELERRERLAEFRGDKIKRLVDGNNTIRLARVLLCAYGSATAYRDQFRAVLTVAADLRSIRHEVDALSIEDRKEAFASWCETKAALLKMQEYLERMDPEFRKEYPAFSARQREAEVSGADRVPKQQSIRDDLLRLPFVKDFVAPDVREAKTDFQVEYNESYNIALKALLTNKTSTTKCP